MDKDLDIAEKIALQMEELVYSQLGENGDCFIGSYICFTGGSHHEIPKDYCKKVYVCVDFAEDMKIPDKLKLPSELEGILILHEKSPRFNLLDC
jgi:hypothetical protein